MKLISPGNQASKYERRNNLPHLIIIANNFETTNKKTALFESGFLHLVGVAIKFLPC